MKVNKYYEEENYYVIKNLGWNQDISAGGSVEFGFGGTEAFRGFPSEYTMLGALYETDDFTIEYFIDSDSEHDFTGRFCITNNTGHTIEDWKLEFEWDETISELWNGILLSHEGSHYVVDNAGYNANIEEGQTVSVGFIGVSDGTHREPADFLLYQYCIGDKEDNKTEGDQILAQTCEQKIDTAGREGIESVAVSLECNGYINNRVRIVDTWNLDMRSTDVVGLIGVPVEITTDVEFSEADIVFSYDKDALGDTDEDNLCIMWYDDKNDNYVLLEDSALDKENHTITYRTTHFSTYLVVDKKIWLDNIRENLSSSQTAPAVYYDLALVVDVSEKISQDALKLEKTALHNVIDGMVE